MPRDFKVYLEDIQLAINKIKKFTVGLSLDDLIRDERTLDAVLRNLGVIGEAVNNIPVPARKKAPAIE